MICATTRTRTRNLRREEQIISGGFPEHKGNGNADDCYGKKNREEGYTDGHSLLVGKTPVTVLQHTEVL